MAEVPPHFHRDRTISEIDVVPDGTLYNALPVSAPEGARAIVDDGVIIQFYRMISGSWVRLGMEFPSLGTAGQALVVNAAADGLEFGSAADSFSMNSKLAGYNTFVIPLFPNLADSGGGGIIGAKQSGIDTVSEFWGSYAEFKSNSATAYYHFKLPGANGSNNINYQWGENKKIVASFKVTYFGSTGAIWGFETQAASLYTLNHSAGHSAVFEWDGSNSKLYARTSDGSATTRTDISSGLTISNWNRFRIEVNPGVNVKFYVNGILKATHTTHLPTTSVVYFGAGLDTSGRWNYMTAPIISIEE